jgi:hypothetical protein
MSSLYTNWKDKKLLVLKFDNLKKQKVEMQGYKT